MMRQERGGIITGWLFRLVLFFLVLGLAFFEAGAVVVAKVSVDGTAETAAREASLTYGTTRNADSARAVAKREAERGGATLESFAVAQDGRSLTLTVRKTASTFVIHRIGPLEDFTVARSSKTKDVK